MIFVTGSTGFIGSNLTKEIGEFTAVPHKEIYTTDFSKATKVYFLSAYGNMADHNDDVMTIKANVIDLIVVLNGIDWNKLESFVFISTSSVRLKVQTMYSRTKKAAEEILLAYMEKYNAPITIIRPFSITGVGEQKAHLIPTLINSIRNNGIVRLDPTPTHDFIDISDVVSGILSLTGKRGIFELGTGVSHSNKEVLAIVEEVMGKTAKVKEVSGTRVYDTDNWVSTNFKARGWGWLPKKTLKESIKEMVNAR